MVFAMLVAAFFVAGIVGPLAAMAGQLYERRKWERRLNENNRLNVPDGQDRMERLEQAVDAIALEVERIGEGQRFVTKQLSDRARVDRTPPSPQPGAVRSVRSPAA